MAEARVDVDKHESDSDDTKYALEGRLRDLVRELNASRLGHMIIGMPAARTGMNEKQLRALFKTITVDGYLEVGDGDFVAALLGGVLGSSDRINFIDEDDFVKLAISHAHARNR